MTQEECCRGGYCRTNPGGDRPLPCGLPGRHDSAVPRRAAERHRLFEELRDPVEQLRIMAAGRCDGAREHRAAVRHHRVLQRPPQAGLPRSEEHTSELQSLMRISYAVFCLKKKIT